MATAAQRLVTESALTARTASVVENATFGRRALTFPSGTVLEVGDTGWINWIALVKNGWTATTMQGRRVGSNVWLRFTGLNPAASTSPYFMDLPLGFGGQFKADIPFALSNQFASLWVSDKSLAVPANSPTRALLPSGVVAHVTIPVDNPWWPDNLGGPKL